MATFKRFEDILAWQKARSVVRDIYLVSAKGSFARDFDLRNQIQAIRGFDHGKYCRGARSQI